MPISFFTVHVTPSQFCTIYIYIQCCNMYRLVCMVGKLMLTAECTTVLCISVHVLTQTQISYAVVVGEYIFGRMHIFWALFYLSIYFLH